MDFCNKQILNSSITSMQTNHEFTMVVVNPQLISLTNNNISIGSLSKPLIGLNILYTDFEIS